MTIRVHYTFRLIHYLSLKLYTGILLLSFSTIHQVNGEQLISSEYDQALFEILNLRTRTAQGIINKQKALDSGDMYYEYLENWKGVIELMAYEDEERYDLYLQTFDARIERIKTKANKSDASYHILLGEIYAHAGMANVMYGDYLSGFGKILKANRNAKKNVSDHPDYWQNNKLFGILNISLARIPSVLKWLTSLFGLTGDLQDGYNRLDRYLADVQEYQGLKSEALLYYAFAYKLTKDEEAAYQLFSQELDIDLAPVLDLFFQANMMYLTGRNEEAIASLSAFPADLPEIPFHHINYMMGKAKLNRLDEDAGSYFENFLSESKFKNYKRDVCMRLAYHYYMQGDLEKYRHYKEAIEEHLKAATDRDREADVENQRSYDPHPELLKARFLTAGSYFDQAHDLIKPIDPDLLERKAFQAEYYLLLAKIYKGKQQYQNSVDYCRTAIEIGMNLSEPYAAEAALLAGKVFQIQGDSDGAHNYWNLALKVDGQKDVYIENIHKRAKYLLKKSQSTNPHLDSRVGQIISRKYLKIQMSGFT